MRFLLAILVICFLGACADQVGYLCQEPSGEAKSCTPDEEMMIDGMNTIIKGIRSFDSSTISKSFFISGVDHPKVVFFGEKHTEIIGMIETLGAINALLSVPMNDETEMDDLVLLEGGDRKTVPDFENCGLYLIYRVYVQWQSEKRGRNYDPAENLSWRSAQKFESIFRSTVLSYDLSGLNIAHVRCEFWDNGKELLESLKRKEINYSSLKVRNKSQVESIDENLFKVRRIIVNTGYAHMPLGEMISLMMKNPQITNLTKDVYYQLVKTEKSKPETHRRIKLPDTAGSSRVIYRYLIEKDIPYLELIHGKMIY